MSNSFRDFMREVEEEARREGPKAVAEAEAFKAHFRLAGELLDLRRKRGLTRRQLAYRAGVNQGELGRIEARNSSATLSTIAALAGALDAEFSLRTRKQAGSSANRRAVAAARRGTRVTVARQVAAPPGRGWKRQLARRVAAWK